MSLTLFQFWKYSKDICVLFFMVQGPSILIKIFCLLPRISSTSKVKQEKNFVNKGGENYLCFSSAVFIMVDEQNMNSVTKIPPSLYPGFINVSLRHKFVSVIFSPFRDQKMLVLMRFQDRVLCLFTPIIVFTIFLCPSNSMLYIFRNYIKVLLANVFVYHWFQIKYQFYN